jgi:hypothetical protein
MKKIQICTPRDRLPSNCDCSSSDKPEEEVVVEVIEAVTVELAGFNVEPSASGRGTIGPRSCLVVSSFNTSMILCESKYPYPPTSISQKKWKGNGRNKKEMWIGFSTKTNP